jgi:sugar-specific transcriptional regulator TrmB
MLASAKTMDALKTIGLNKYERGIWVALLSRGTATAGELSEISNVPRSRCYDILQSLADKGFVVVQPGKPLRYLAVEPKEAFERAKNKVLEEAQELTEKLERIKKSDVIKELEKIHKENVKIIKPEEISGALKGRYSLLQQVGTMLKNAKKSVKMITSEDGLNELVEAHGDLLKKISQAGIDIKIAAPLNKNTESAYAELSKIAELRNLEDVEHIEKLTNARIFLVDGETAVVGLADDQKTHPTQDVAFWTKSSHATSKIFEPMFNLVWSHAKPYKK